MWRSYYSVNNLNDLFGELVLENEKITEPFSTIGNLISEAAEGDQNNEESQKIKTTFLNFSIEVLNAQNARKLDNEIGYINYVLEVGFRYREIVIYCKNLLNN